MREDDRRVIGFAAAVCVTCSLLLSATATLLRDRQEYNVELDRKTNVLKAFGVEVMPGGKKISPAEVETYFEDHISDLVIDAGTGEVLEGVGSEALTREELKQKTRLPLYLWEEDGEVTRYAFPVSGKGLWSTIYGYMALDRDLATIIGITFYKHGETPGLGGEISTDWFQAQFEGKHVWADGALLPFEVVKGSVEGKYPGGNDHAVDGISGATITGNGVSIFLNEDLARYDKYFSRIRGA
jgi:Na+-transporting NADH:ubiquinone oxidoreductase subunit C